jgi:hypothetical protein
MLKLEVSLLLIFAELSVCSRSAKSMECMKTPEGASSPTCTCLEPFTHDPKNVLTVKLKNTTLSV